MNERIKDSVRNCVISIALDEPPNFFIPTSFALLDAWAVERFMKLIAAINTISNAILPKIIKKLWIACRFKFLLNTMDRDGYLSGSEGKICICYPAFQNPQERPHILLKFGSYIFLSNSGNFSIHSLITGVWFKQQICTEAVTKPHLCFLNLGSVINEVIILASKCELSVMSPILH